jgi:hypothetical protein
MTGKAVALMVTIEVAALALIASLGIFIVWLVKLVEE